MEVRLLGPLEVRRDDRVLVLSRRQQRALLAALALRAGEVVSSDRLVLELWGERAPATASGSLQNTVSALRKLLGRETLVTQAPGYVLALDRDAVDANRFERLLAEARASEPAERARLLHDALALWRGPALADLDDEFARLEGRRLDELRVSATEDRIEADLLLGRHASLVAELETLVSRHPLRERLRGQLMLALYRCGRQAEALEVYRATRLALADELGLDPSPALQELERRMLRQDPALAAPAEHEAAAPPAPPAEVRLVTVLAALPPAADDPEQHHRDLDETLRRAGEVLERYGGTLERFGPEGLVAVFGLEHPHDDDARRAVLSAQELGLPAGVATGEVVHGTGSVVVRAVELARAGGIALDARTEALVRSERRLDAPLAGRRDELAVLARALAQVRRTRRCRVVTVLGEPGIGKTRLAREVARRAGRVAVLDVRCTDHGGRGGLVPVLEALQNADVEAALAAEPDAELVRSRLLAARDRTASAPVGESYWAVRRVLESLARGRPALLVVDDLQWAEAALLDLVDYLAERADAPLLVLCLARPELERPPGERLVLGPLGEDEARAVVAGAAHLDDAAAERIVCRAEGNPLYAEQLAAFAAEGGEGLPPTLEAVLAARLGRLGDAERAVLQRGAVVGREFSRETVAALADDDVSASLAALSRRGLVHAAPAREAGDDGFSFHHALLREAAYASLTKADRAGLHERLAAWLDRDGTGDDAVVGFHLEQTALLRRALGDRADDLAAAAGERLGRAGLRIQRTNHAATAAGVLARATALLPAGAERGGLLWELSLALRATGAAEDAARALGLAEADARASGARALSARVRAEDARIRLAAGELPLDEAATAMTRALRVLEAEGDARGMGRAALGLAGLHLFGCNHAEVERAAAEAAAFYLRAGFSPAACVGAQAEGIYLGEAPVPEAMRRCERLLADADDAVTAALVSGVLGALRGLVGEVEAGRALVADARALFDDLGSHFGATTTLVPLELEVERCAGDLEHAEAVARASLDELTSAGSATVAYSTSRALDLAEILLAAGRDDDAEPLVAFADRHAVRSDVYVQILRRSTRARLAARRGAADEAGVLAREAAALASQTDGLVLRARTHLASAEVAAHGGRGEERAEAGREALRLLRRKGATALVAAAEAELAAH